MRINLDAFHSLRRKRLVYAMLEGKERQGCPAILDLLGMHEEASSRQLSVMVGKLVLDAINRYHKPQAIVHPHSVVNDVAPRLGIVVTPPSQGSRCRLCSALSYPPPTVCTAKEELPARTTSGPIDWACAHSAA